MNQPFNGILPVSTMRLHKAFHNQEVSQSAFSWTQSTFGIFRKGLATVLLSSLLSVSLIIPQAEAQPVNILRNIPLEISSYKATMALPEKYTTSKQVMETLQLTDNLLVHMETLRQAHHQLPALEKKALLDTLFQRYRAENSNPYKFFDHGYAQLVFEKNKTGLFFLRKANDKIQTQFSNLAYAMAEAEVDMELENSPADEMSTRKLSVMFNLRDALNRHREKQKPGFWPSFVSFVNQLKQYPAYQDFADEDFSLTFVPYGGMSSFSTSTPNTNKEEGTTAGLAGNICTTVTEAPSQLGTLFNYRMVDFNADAELEKVAFYMPSRPMTAESISQPIEYDVLITGNKGDIRGHFTTYSAPYIIEDLEGDGKLEVVIRQYRYDPLHPVKVFRKNACGFSMDDSIQTYFK